MTETVDVVVIGAGINGAGVAQAAAAAGCSVLVLERTGIASGTSSRSSKLIHGGLRYLETGQFRLVRESLRERARLLALAPGLVRLVPFFIPVYRSMRRRPATIRAGLSIYALLGGLARTARFSTVPRRQWARLDGIETGGLEAVFRYFDAQTDDAALTRAVMRSAQSLGAELALPARLIGARLETDGVAVEFDAGGRTQSRFCRVLINAAGPWVSRVLGRITPHTAGLAIDLIRGTHICLDRRFEHGIYYLEAEDGRAVFVMPRDGKLLIGTTEARHAGDPDTVTPTDAEQDYLLRTVGRHFPALAGYNRDNVQSAFAGLRVLPRGDGRAFDRPREMRFTVDRAHRPRLLTVYGGKLTTFRATAAHVMQRISESLPSRAPRGDTNALPLDGD